MNRTKIIFFFISLIDIISCSWAFADESISITTYYPSPYGVYNEMRLYPHTTPIVSCDSTTEGTMFYNLSAHELQVCNGSGSWKSGGGFWASSGDDIYNTNTGNVGIGTASPGARLQISPNIINNYPRPLYVRNDGTEGAGIHPLAIMNDLDNGLAMGAQNGETFASIDARKFVNGIGTFRLDLVLNRGGSNVGIGTTTPAGRLTINGEPSTGNNAGILQIFDYTPGRGDISMSGGADSLFAFNNYGDAANGATYFRSSSSGVNSILYLKNDGNVGIGTTAPRGTLDVQGPIFFAGRDPDFIPSGLPSIGTEATDSFFIVPTYTGTEDSDLRLYIEDNLQDRFSIWGVSCNGGFGCGHVNGSMMGHYFQANGDAYHAGNLGIGVVNPTHRIHLAGGAYCNGNAGWIAGSDRAYKKDIDYNFRYGLKEIEQLKPVYYIHKQDETNKKQIGFIAQDVKEVIPEVVDGVEGTYGLAYERFVPVLVNAIKELEKQVEDLKAQINELKRN